MANHRTQGARSPPVQTPGLPPGCHDAAWERGPTGRPGHSTGATSHAGANSGHQRRQLSPSRSPRGFTIMSTRALAGFIAVSAVFVAVFVALTLSAFHEPVPHDLPVGIVGSATVTRQVEHALDSAAPGAFRFRSYRSAGGAT